MGLLLKCGKQILGLSSAAAAAKSGQQFGISAAANKCSNLLTTTTTKSSSMIHSHHGRFLGANNNKYFSTNTTQIDNDLKIPKIPKMLLFRYVAGKFLFGRNYFPLPFGTPPLSTFKGLLDKFTEMAEESKYCPQDRLPEVLDEIRPVLYEMLKRGSDKAMVRFVYEFARPAASPSSPPPVVIDSLAKEIVDNLPSHVIHLFQDMMMDMLVNRFNSRTFFNVAIHRYPRKSLEITADVSDIGRDHLKVFVVKDKFLMITGTHKNAPPVPARVLPKTSTIHHIIELPICPYSHDEHTASILQEDQGRPTQLKIVFPIYDERLELMVNRPRVFQLNLDTQGTPQG